jgi:hypothetical protein
MNLSHMMPFACIHSIIIIIVALLADTANWIEENRDMQQQMPTTANSMMPMTIAVSIFENAISSKWTDHFWSNLFLDQIVSIVPSTRRSPLDWYKDLVTTSAPQHSSNRFMRQQQQGRDGNYHSSNHNNAIAATTALNSMSLTSTTPISSWSLQVQQPQQQHQQPRPRALQQQQQQDEPHFKQQKRFHDTILERAVTEYAIIMQDDHDDDHDDDDDDDDYKNGHATGGCIVFQAISS